MTSPFWLSDPTILIQPAMLRQLWPTKNLSYNEQLNAISRLVLLLSLAGYLIFKSIKYVLAGVITLGSIVFLHHMQLTKEREGFGSRPTPDGLYDLIRPHVTEPTTQNPLMNVLLPEINDNPRRNMAAPTFNAVVQSEINQNTQNITTSAFTDPNIDQRLFTDLGDSFTFDRSMLQFSANPNTTIPNDQEGFAKYCYEDMISCRDETNNELACTRNMPPRWTNI
jgi:hypothetical protein